MRSVAHDRFTVYINTYWESWDIGDKIRSCAVGLKGLNRAEIFAALSRFRGELGKKG